jgi:hypothetical protein
MVRSFRSRISWRTARRTSVRVPAALRSAESGRIERIGMVPFSFERKIAAPMNKMMIGRLGSKVQSTLDSFFR